MTYIKKPSDIFWGLRQYELSKNEIENALANKELLTASVATIAQRFEKYPWTDYVHANLPDVLKRFGIRCVVLPDDRARSVYGEASFSESGLSFFLSDYYLLVGYRGMTSVIPLEKIKRFEFVPSSEAGKITSTEPIYGEKSVIKGAVIGGAIAGPAGAVVGALNNKGKTEIKQARLFYKNTNLSFVLAIEDDVYELTDAIEQSTTDLKQSTSANGFLARKSDSMIVNEHLGLCGYRDANRVFLSCYAKATESPAGSRKPLKAPSSVGYYAFFVITGIVFIGSGIFGCMNFEFFMGMGIVLILCGIGFAAFGLKEYADHER